VFRRGLVVRLEGVGGTVDDDAHVDEDGEGCVWVVETVGFDGLAVLCKVGLGVEGVDVVDGGGIVVDVGSRWVQIVDRR